MDSEKKRFHIEGMTCQTCANRIEKVLGKKEGIHQATVNFASEQAQIVFDPALVNAGQIQEWIVKTGFQAAELDTAQPQVIEKNEFPWRTALLVILSLPFFVEMTVMFSGQGHWLSWKTQCLLASIVQLWLAMPFYRGAIAAIKGRMANMDVLVSLGTGTIYLYSLLVYLLGYADTLPLYFEAGVMVITFVSFGKMLEERSKRDSLNDMKLLLTLTPKTVSRQVDDRWQTVALSAVEIGDRLLAKSGDRIAADGTLCDGKLWCDESHLTGESKIITKVPGDKVLAGAMVSDGSGVYRSDRLGQDTLLGDMMSALSEAQGSKAPIARIADQVAGIFVPVVVLIAILTFAITWCLTGSAVTAMLHAVAVLVIACPCAMGLATPAAVMVGMGQAVQRGIWFRDAAALEAASHIDTVAFDKTGTITRGQPNVAAAELLVQEFDQSRLLQIAASVEQYANHPLARALVNAAQTQQLALLPAQDFSAQAGEGISAYISDVGSVKVGSPAYLNLALPIQRDPVWKSASIVAVSIDDRPIGAFAIADTLKDDSKAAVNRLHQMGVRVMVLSGDHQQVVDHIAAQAGIDQALGNMTPRAKAESIQTMVSEGRKVAMVGDGVNDAPALAAATVSFAMKDGADIAENNASATLMRHSINQVADALTVANATMRNIKQNLFFAFIYNVIGIPLAAFGVLSPIFAGAAMALSSVSVIGNAMRLKWQLEKQRQALVKTTILNT